MTPARPGSPGRRPGAVRFTPLTPARLVDELAKWVRARAADLAGAAPGGSRGTVIGFDGAAEIGTSALAEEVAVALRSSGRVVITASTSWWWRPSALRLELGRHDVDMLLTGWVDAAAARRELIDPIVAGGLPYITRLRDPQTDRSVRQPPQSAQGGAILLLDGPFLLAGGLVLDGHIFLRVGVDSLRRALPSDRAWWLAGFERYEDEYGPAEPADVVVSYDHAWAPAATGLVADPFM